MWLSVGTVRHFMFRKGQWTFTSKESAGFTCFSYLVILSIRWNMLPIASIDLGYDAYEAWLMQTIQTIPQVLQWHPVLPPSPLLFNKVTVMDGYILRIMDPKVEHLPNLLQNFGLHGGAAVYVSVVLWSAAREAALSPSADECWVCVPAVWPSLNTSSQGATCLRPSFYEKRGVVWTPLLSPVSRAPRVRQPSCTSSRRPRGSRLSSPREMGQKRLILCRMSSVSLRAPALAFLLI